MPGISLDISHLPSPEVKYEVDGDQVKATLLFAGQEIASDVFQITGANAEGFSYAKHEKTFDAIVQVRLTFEIWIRWNDRKVVLVVLYRAPDPIGRGKKEVWGDF
ncbi:hypothetical protein NSQ38_03345 [Paenibacillus sp. FSL R7-0313]|uniref:hypothetical protein n=1 Tax=Paenibacillus sp. FSL R7-0313 TaxID=2954532 RepID=UPI0030D746C2